MWSASRPRIAAVLKAALKGAGGGNLMVVGIQPRWPETGYGYIEFPKGTAAGGREPVAVRRFHEKPELPKAKRYVAAGNYYWNSGMFFWRADVLLDELRQHLPKTATILASLPAFGARKFAAEMKRCFPALREHLDRLRGAREGASTSPVSPAADFGWNDVGSWNAVYELLPRDEHGNVVVHDSVVLDSHNNFVDARGKIVALLGVKDLIVVDTPDALLVASRDRAQSVGEILKDLEKRGRHELL